MKLYGPSSRPSRKIGRSLASKWMSEAQLQCDLQQSWRSNHWKRTVRSKKLISKRPSTLDLTRPKDKNGLFSAIILSMYLQFGCVYTVYSPRWRHLHHFNSRIPISCQFIIFYNNSFILDFFHFDNQENREMGNCYCPRIKIILKERIYPLKRSSSKVIWGHNFLMFGDWSYQERTWRNGRNGTVSIRNAR